MDWMIDWAVVLFLLTIAAVCIDWAKLVWRDVTQLAKYGEITPFHYYWYKIVCLWVFFLGGYNLAAGVIKLYNTIAALLP